MEMTHHCTLHALQMVGAVNHLRNKNIFKSLRYPSTAPWKHGLFLEIKSMCFHRLVSQSGYMSGLWKTWVRKPHCMTAIEYDGEGNAQVGGSTNVFTCSRAVLGRRQQNQTSGIRSDEQTSREVVQNKEQFPNYQRWNSLMSSAFSHWTGLPWRWLKQKLNINQSRQ